jgi:hypothetical protein
MKRLKPITDSMAQVYPSLEMIRKSLIWPLWVAMTIVSSSCNKTEETLGAERNTKSRTASRDSAKIGADESASPRSVALAGRDPTKAEAWHRLSADWDELAREYSGEELLAKQKELALRAVGKLGAGPELLEFLDYLTERGAGDVRE